MRTMTYVAIDVFWTACRIQSDDFEMKCMSVIMQHGTSDDKLASMAVMAAHRILCQSRLSPNGTLHGSPASSLSSLASTTGIISQQTCSCDTSRHFQC